MLRLHPASLSEPWQITLVRSLQDLEVCYSAGQDAHQLQFYTLPKMASNRSKVGFL